MTSLIRFHYNPATGLERLFDNAFNARLYAFPSSINRRRSVYDPFHPRMDVNQSEDGNTITATFELPGLKPGDVTIDLHQNRLTVSGEFAASNAQERDGNSISERRRGNFSRTLPLPFGTKPEDVKAKLENGLLTVAFPKTTPEQQAHRITIE